MFEEIFAGKTTKPKEKTQALCDWLIKNPKKINELLAFAAQAKDPVKASCIEAIEFATKEHPETGTAASLEFVTGQLSSKSPRVRWESAKVIGNIAHLYPTKLSGAIKGLLANAEHEGTVVRWSAAYALSEIVKLNSSMYKTLAPVLEAVMKSEEKNSIKKIYAGALKKAAKK